MNKKDLERRLEAAEKQSLGLLDEIKNLKAQLAEMQDEPEIPDMPDFEDGKTYWYMDNELDEVGDSNALDEAIQHLRETLADPTHKWGCEECKKEHEQLLEFLQELKLFRETFGDVKNTGFCIPECKEHFRDGNGWISCSERMPDDDVDVLVYDDGILIARYNADDEYTSGWMESFECYPLTNVTHWMTLPEPPTRKDDTHDND